MDEGHTETRRGRKNGRRPPALPLPLAFQITATLPFNNTQDPPACQEETVELMTVKFEQPLKGPSLKVPSPCGLFAQLKVNVPEFTLLSNGA